MNYRKINNVTGWSVFGIATIVYFMTMEKSGSLWDCGEFASCCHKLGIPHPPGAPLFTLIGRMFAVIGQPLGMGPVGGINLMSALASSFTILFLFWTITHFARKIVLRKSGGGDGDGTGNNISQKDSILIMLAGAVGALAYTFSDSFWFSAVEAEVYAMSSLFTALVFWALMKWEDHPLNTNEPGNVNGRNQADKWLIFIFFMIGLSIGVHLLNLLTIPAVVLVYYFKRYKYSAGGLAIAFLISLLILGFVQKFIGQATVSIGFQFDKLFVNSFGLPVFTGFIFFYVLFGALIWFLLRWANANQKGMLRLGLWCMAFILIGMSTYMTTMIRSRANPGIDMYNVDNPYTLKGYLAREQYGKFPLLKGQHYKSEPTEYKKGSAKYVLRKDENGKLRYIFSGYDRDPAYSGDDEMLFPRMWDNNDPNHVQFYKLWLGKEDDETPTMKDNFRWGFTYQLNWMYFRYFMWNFAGRQNDIQGLSSSRDGNWISGISFLDNWRLGDQSAMPDSLKNNKAHNKLYFLPLILGLIGFFFHFKSHKKDWLITSLLFVMTGLAIVFYLNMAGPQPRERDYAFVGSFYAFAIWIGLGVMQVRAWLKKLVAGETATYIAGALCALAVPVLMATQEWDDHNRGQKTLARDLAHDYLQSCPQNAMLFTIGDNDTYPLWYAQEVEGIRTDVRVVNTSLLGIDWYLDQLRYAVNNSQPFKMVWKPTDYEGPKMEYAIERPYNNISTKTVFPLDTMLMIAPRMSEEIDGIDRHFYPGKNVYVNLDRNKLMKILTLSPGDTLTDRLNFSIEASRNYLTKGDFAILNIIAANINDRPICFTDENNEIRSLGLTNYLRREGMIYRLVPAGNLKRTETDVASAKLDKEFKFGNAQTKGVYFDEENRRHLQSIRDVYVEVALELVNESRAAEARGNTDEAKAKMEKAKQLLKKTHTNIPSYSLPYGIPSRGGFNNYSSLRMAEAAFLTGDSALGREVFAEVEKDIQQELRYQYTLSNPGGKPTKQNVDRFIAEFEEFLNVARQPGQGARANALADNLFKNKLTGFNQQDGYALMRNYSEAKRMRGSYIDKAVAPPPQPGEIKQPAIVNPAPPAAVPDTKKPK